MATRQIVLELIGKDKASKVLKTYGKSLKALGQNKFGKRLADSAKGAGKALKGLGKIKTANALSGGNLTRGYGNR